MIEEIVLNFLLEKLNMPVYLEMPENPPEEFVIIEKTGGGKNNKIASSTIAIQSYAKTLFFAAKLNENVKKVMEDIVDLNEITKSELNTDYNFTDTSTKRYRYQAVYDIVHY